MPPTPRRQYTFSKQLCNHNLPVVEEKVRELDLRVSKRRPLCPGKGRKPQPREVRLPASLAQGDALRPLFLTRYLVVRLG